MSPFWLISTLALLPLSPPPAPTALDARLSKPVDISWELRPLGEGLQTLARQHQLNLVIDARLDRTFRVTGNPRNTPLEEVLDMLARLVGGRAVVIGEIVLIGSRKSADRAATSALLCQQRLTGLSPALRRRLASRRSGQWRGEASVASLLKPVVQELGLTLASTEKLQVTPKPNAVIDVATIDLLLVLFAQCDQTVEIDEAAGQLNAVDLPANPLVERRVHVPVSRARRTAREYQQAVPELEIEVAGADLKVRGTYLALRTLDRYRSKETRSEGTARVRTGPRHRRGAKHLYSITMRNTTLKSFAAKLTEITGKQVTIDESSLRQAGKSPLDRLSCSVNHGTLEEILHLALTPGGLTYQVRGSRVVISAIGKD